MLQSVVVATAHKEVINGFDGAQFSYAVLQQKSKQLPLNAWGGGVHIRHRIHQRLYGFSFGSSRDIRGGDVFYPGSAIRRGRVRDIGGQVGAGKYNNEYGSHFAPVVCVIREIPLFKARAINRLSRSSLDLLLSPSAKSFGSLLLSRIRGIGRGDLFQAANCMLFWAIGLLLAAECKPRDTAGSLTGPTHELSIKTQDALANVDAKLSDRR
jgi:hypothetical protein